MHSTRLMAAGAGLIALALACGQSRASNGNEPAPPVIEPQADTLTPIGESASGSPSAVYPDTGGAAVATPATPAAETTTAGETPRGGMMGRGMMGGGMMRGGMTGAAATGGAVTGTAAQDSASKCPPIDSTMIQKGSNSFNAVCSACHGSDGQGTPIAPNLNDGKWLLISGSYASIDSLVLAGVAKPKGYPAPMPPKGGGNFTDEQVCQLAAYVYSLSHE